jgi:SAM-dependent methyltransferase
MPEADVRPGAERRALRMEHVACNVCGEDRYEEHLRRRDLMLFLPGEFRLVRCLNCGLVYLNPRPVPEQLAELYEGEYDQYNPAVVDEKPLKRLDRRYGLRKRCQAILRHKQAGHLLDVGCATGDFLETMRTYAGWQVSGVELSEAASRYARERLGLDVRTGTLKEAHYAPGTFDVITLWNVIEHLTDPVGELSEMNKLLRPGGLLVFTTPNLNSLDARLFGRYWIGYELPRHYFVFSDDTVAALLARTGFRLAETRCLYGSYAAFMASVRFWLRDGRLAGRTLDWVERALFFRPLRLALAPLFFMADRLKLSSGPTYLCIKVS